MNKLDQKVILAYRNRTGSFFRECRERRGITTYQLEKVGVKNYLEIENGSTNYTIDSMIKYLHAIGVKHWFSELSEENYEKSQELD